MHICLHTYIPVDCAFPCWNSSQSSKASWETFEATALEKRCWNGTKARLEAAWRGHTEERPPPSYADEEERGLLALMGSLSIQLLKGRTRTAGWGFLRFHPEMRHDRWPAWRSHAFQNYSHPRYQDLSALTHTHTDLICFPSPCGDWNIHISHKPTHTHTHSPIVGYPSQVPSMHLQDTHSHFHTSLFLPAHRNELKEEFLLCGSNGLWVLHFQSVTAVSRHFSQALLPLFSYFWRWKGEKKDKHILHFLFKVHYTASIWGGRVGEELIPRRVRENALTESYPSSNWHIHLNVCLLFLKRCRPKIIALFLSSFHVHLLSFTYFLRCFYFFLLLIYYGVNLQQLHQFTVQNHVSHSLNTHNTGVKCIEIALHHHCHAF